tara:strand:- start:1331 stop:1735 length:405 start_codon:yes stop_codon:yes gene_type:complete
MEIIGTRVTLAEDEGRRLFADQLPLNGEIEKVYPGELHNPWCLLKLDQGFDYQVENKETKEFRGFRVDRILIRSRWEGCAAGGTQPTSVFVLIADEESKFDTDKIDIKDFYFESWAMSTTLTNPQLTSRWWQRR